MNGKPNILDEIVGGAIFFMCLILVLLAFLGVFYSIYLVTT